MIEALGGIKLSFVRTDLRIRSGLSNSFVVRWKRIFFMKIPLGGEKSYVCIFPSRLYNLDCTILYEKRKVIRKTIL